VIWKEGLAACSTLTLGCVCRCGPLLAGGWTGGGTLGPESIGASPSSSSRLTESIIPRIDEVEAVGVGRGLRDEAGSFCGGAGGASGAEGGVGAPKGPKGSSTASRCVFAGAYCFLRGPRPAGERGAAEALGTELSVALDEERDS
jgi:hypothetical protein